MISRGRGCSYSLLVLLAIAAAVWFGRHPLLAAAGRALVENDGPQKAQAIVVLGGDDYGCRIIKAAQLATEGYAPFVIVSGPRMLLGHESDMTIQYAEQKGHPASLFHPLPNDTHSTRSETLFIGKYLREHGIRKILLVTSNYHTRRAAHLMRSQNPGLQVAVIPAPDPYFTPDGWWKTREGQKTFLIEWLKTAATWLGF